MRHNKGLRTPMLRGFTLIEIVIAITLSAVLFTILFSALRLGQRSQEKGIEREDISQRMRILSDRLSWLIRGAYPYIVRKPEGNVLFFSGTASNLGFVTTSVDAYSEEPEDKEGLKWVRIFRDSDGLKIKENIYLIEDNLEDIGGNEYVFDPDVGSIEFKYLDTSNEGKKDTWVSSWSPKEKDYLPSAVKVMVVIEHNSKKIEMPPIVTRIITGGGGTPPSE